LSALWLAVGVALLSSVPSVASASGCFGGEPDVRPHAGAGSLPANTQVRIARRDAAAVSWTGPGGAMVAFDNRRVGMGRSAGHLLTPLSPLAAGTHTVRTAEPDGVHRFTVGQGLDRTPPRLRGDLALEARFAPEPGSSCPENIWIRATLVLPEDDYTGPDGFSYLVTVSQATAGPAVALLVHAESVTATTVRFRIGETGCGCLPHVPLTPGTPYRLTIRAIDVAGHVSIAGFAAEVTIPAEARPASGPAPPTSTGSPR
jgi:hypothetical protein